MYIEQIIASRLKALRTHFGYSIETMARITGYKVPDYYYLENSPSCFGAETIKHLCQQLNCSADYLLGLSDNISPPPQKIPRDPFDDLTVDQRVTIEAALSAFRAANAAKAQEA